MSAALSSPPYFDVSPSRKSRLKAARFFAASAISRTASSPRQAAELGQGDCDGDFEGKSRVHSASTSGWRGSIVLGELGRRLPVTVKNRPCLYTSMLLIPASLRLLH